MEQPTCEENHPKCSIFTAPIDMETGPAQVKQLMEALKDQRNNDTSPGERFVIIGNRALHDEAITLSEFFIRLWRRYRLHSNERQTVLSAEDQLVVVQLCLAGMNKQKLGDFDVEASTVIEMQKSLQKDKLRQLSDKDTSTLSLRDEYHELRQAYDSYLSNCNAVDVIDVFRMVREEAACNKDLMLDLYSPTFVLVSKIPGVVEMEMMRYLAEKCSQVKVCKLCTPLGGGGGEEEEKVFVESEESSLEEALKICEDMRVSASSVTEVYVKGVVLSYMQLLVNSRCELALARSLNVPDRELNHDAFTALKREAQTKGLSMYQTAMSYVMRIRMGGSGHASASASPLGLYVKGMSEYIDMMHKLQTVIEEETNSAKAIKRAINLIKNTKKKKVPTATLR